MDDSDDLDRIAEVLGERTADEFDEAAAGSTGLDRYDVLSDTRANAAGLVRYWKKREEARGDGAEPAPVA
jgi:hypothetical protein